MNNKQYTTADVKRVCENKLGVKFRNGAEQNGWFILDGVKCARITVPKGKKDIPPKTYKSMSTQLRLNVEDFDRLLACPLKRDEYEAILKSKISESTSS